MHHLLHSFSRNAELTQLILFAGTLFLCWNIENIAGPGLGYSKWKHAFSNTPFVFTNLPGQILLSIVFIKTISWTGMHHFGVLYYLRLQHRPLLLFIVSFVLLDLGEYIYHVIMHRVKRLWMFHLVHHSDPVVDVSTTLREHPGENIIRLMFTLLWVFLTGSLLWVLLLRQTIQIFTTFIAHTNYQVSEKADRWLGFLFITPNLHRVHHHYRQPYTDSNYGDVLSIWDRMFGTFQKFPEEPLIFGVDTYSAQEDTAKFGSVFRIPFGKYRSRCAHEDHPAKTSSETDGRSGADLM